VRQDVTAWRFNTVTTAGVLDHFVLAAVASSPWFSVPPSMSILSPGFPAARFRDQGDGSW